MGYVMNSQREKDMNALLKANLMQCKALKKLNPDNNLKLNLDMISTFGYEWRVIINEFIERTGRIPTEDDLIWCSSLDEHLGKDIRLIVKELKTHYSETP